MASSPSRAARRHARRQVRARVRPRLPDRRAGAGAPADAAAAARRAAGPQHRRLHLRLSRLAARRLRPGAVEGEEVPRARATSSSSRASTRTSPRPSVWGTQQVDLYRGRQVRRRVRHVVRQGPGRRPLRRRVQARATAPARRSTAACWCSPATTTRPSRRPLPHQSRPRFVGRDDAGALSVVACRRSSTSACTAGR